MIPTPNRLLALKPGTRELGIALFQDEELFYYGIKTIAPRETPQEILTSAVHLLKKLVLAYRPSALVIEQTIVLQASASFLLVVAKKLKAAARRSGLTVYEYPPAQVRKFFCQPERATKLLTAQRIAERYPHLARHLSTNVEWEWLYYAHLFDAIALGLYGLHQLPKEETNDMLKAALVEDENSFLPREPQAGKERQNDHV